MIFCARATRGRGKPSLGLMARLGVPVGGRVRKSRAVEDQSAPIPEEITSKLGGIIYIVRRAHVGTDSCHPLRGGTSKFGGTICNKVRKCVYFAYLFS